jgi:hypothetical protein
MLQRHSIPVRAGNCCAKDEGIGVSCRQIFHVGVFKDTSRLFLSVRLSLSVFLGTHEGISARLENQIIKQLRSEMTEKILQSAVGSARDADSYFSATFFSTSSIRVCHPGPVALKYSRTAGERRRDTSCLVADFCLPRCPGRRMIAAER